MKRHYRILDAQGERTLTEADLPLRLGGDGADIVVPGLADNSVLAVIALSQGHAFVQAVDQRQAVYHNHQRLTESAWLKSGDELEAGEGRLSWRVLGDQVRIEALQGGASATDPADSSWQTLKPEPLPVAATAQARKRGGAFGFLLVGVLFLAMAGAAAFILLAGSVQVRVQPAAAQLQMTGFPPPVPIAGRFLALPGEYRLLARHDGYHPVRKNFTLARADTLEFDLSLQERPGRVRLHSEPASQFTLFVDQVETAPNAQGEFEIARGQRDLRLVSERYLPEEVTIEVQGLGVAQSVHLALKPAWADVRLTTSPSGAQVRIDKQLIGRTPLSAELMQGTRTFEFSLDGYKPTEQMRDIKAGEPLRLDLVLSPADGVLMLDSQPTAASVSLDGVFQGSTPIRLLVLPDAEHQLTLSKAGFNDLTQTILLSADQQQTLNLNLKPAYGTIFLSSTPADARLLVDGKPAGTATQRLRLSAVAHRLEIRKAGYVSKTLTVTPRVGGSQSFDVRLLSKARRQQLNTPERIETKAGQSLLLQRPQKAFEMGASRREAGRRANENLRQVQLTRAFYLGDKEVSNAQFRQFQPAHRSGAALGAVLDGDDQPVVNVSWEDAARYCNWLSKQQGLPEAYEEKGGKLQLKRPVNTGYRLPSEAEWAYVARFKDASSARKYGWQGAFPPQQPVGNFADAQIADSLADVTPGGYDDGFRVSAPVGRFAQQPNGFYDLGGNVAEWTGDYYAVYPGVLGKISKDPLGPDSGRHRVIKGASWRHGDISALRLSYRDYGRKPRDDLGFRIARYAQ